MLDAVRHIGAGEGESVLLRLNTRPVEQDLFPAPQDGTALEELRNAVLGGAYRYRSANPAAEVVVNLFAVGPTVPEALAAVAPLEEEGIDASVFVVTSPDLLYRKFRESALDEADGRLDGPFDPTGLLADFEVGRPLVTVIDGHPQALSFLGTALDCPSVNLGVDAFGQSGSRAELYGLFRIDTDGIFAAALGLVDRERRRRA